MGFLASVTIFFEFSCRFWEKKFKNYEEPFLNYFGYSREFQVHAFSEIIGLLKVFQESFTPVP